MNLLTIFYLQQLEKPILPPLIDIANLERQKSPNSETTFINDLSQLKFKTTNSDSVADLIIGFMKFYAQFDFSKYAIHPEGGIAIEKTDGSNIDIIDLFGTENVATNVNRRYSNILRRALMVSDKIAFDLAGEVRRAHESWGLVQFYKKCVENDTRKRHKIV